MRKSKKILISALLIAVVLIGGTTGIVLAQTGDNGQSKMSNLLDRVVTIYKEKTGVDIDAAKLQESMTQAQSEARDKAQNDRLQAMVDAGKITKEQADQYKTWLKNTPDMSQYRQQLKDWQGTRPDMPQQFKDWQNAKPDMPMMGPGGMMPGPSKGGMGFMGRGGEFCLPPTP